MSNNDECMDISIRNEYTLYTGGCTGVDRCAEDIAKSLGFQVHVMIGLTHQRVNTITPISYLDLHLANPALHKANETLKRNISSLPPYCMELLQRNWYIIKDVTTVYAFGEFSNNDKKQLKGGTGWSVQMAIDANKSVYVYDVKSITWHQPFHYKWNKKRDWVKDFYLLPFAIRPGRVTCRKGHSHIFIKQEIFKHFQATTVTIRFNPPLPPSLTGFNIQASVTNIVTSESRESP